MAANLARAGFELTVWNRTKAKADQFQTQHGATVAGTPAEAAAEAEVAITMVVDGPQVEQVLLGDEGVAQGARGGLLCIDCSTIGPAATRAIGEVLSSRGLALVDAPVTGSAPRAEDGTLTIMVGGSDADVERGRPVLEAMGKLIVHAGPLGHGQMVKLLNNAVAATNAATIAQALIVAARTGVDLPALIEVMGNGAAASTMLDLKAEPMTNHDYTTLFEIGPSGREEVRPFFRTDHMLKDVRLCLEEAQAAGVPFPFAALSRDLLAAASGRGLGEADFSALVEVLEGAAGFRL
jgi:3-hydroxyisobutyrate dehydrogenase-like beta-hydroxyacid dehydrogenase